MLLKLPYIVADSKSIERKRVDITSRTIFFVRILFTSKPILQRSGKDLMTPEKILLSTSINATAKVERANFPISKNKNKRT